MSSKHGRELRAAVIADLQRAGITLGPLVHGGKHWRQQIIVNGHSRKITLPDSPSDVRAQQNARHRVKRMLKEWAQQ
jgi:hypothetical protein